MFMISYIYIYYICIICILIVYINYTYYTYIILMMFVDVYGDHFKMILRLENRKAKRLPSKYSLHTVEMRRLKSCIGLATNVEERFVLAQSPMM